LDLDVGMSGEPGGDGAALPVRQEIDGAATFEIADDRSIALALEPGEIVDADHPNGRWRRCCPPAQEAQQRVGADRYREAFGKPFSGTAAEHEGNRVREHVEREVRRAWAWMRSRAKRSVKTRRSHTAFRQ